MKKISIVIPIYYNESNIPHTVPELKKLKDLIPDHEMEFIFVDDGSKDKSLELLLKERIKDNSIKVIKLSRNFGSMCAIQAGIQNATGDYVGIITADLQDPPELFVNMLKKLKNGSKIVIATRKDREESIIQKFLSNTFYSLISIFAIKDYPKGGFDFVLFDKQIAGDINHIKEKNTNIMSLIFWLGYDRDFIYYTRKRREHGKSRWTFSKKIKFFIDSFIAFSYAPIRFISFLGLSTACLSFSYGIFVIINAILGKITVQGYAALITIITFLLGLIMIMLGIIGEYLWRILDETRKRPSFIIDKKYTDEK